ncbi:DUF1579 family protein [Candidatus Leptofilum sp.]|uniref:DUF1579 family protein n=1 Tax=Candidatus Leptofilum sp. TaxID=3241576 RepID=UPI003B594F90
MTVSKELMSLTGNWQGTNRLWLDPSEPARKSVATAVLQPTAKGKFATLHYSWADAGQPQEGLLLFGANGDQVDAAWVDSWHMQHVMMYCTGEIQPDGGISVLGSYAAPPGPDWGWRITIQPLSEAQFKFLMHNITPEGEAALAVEVLFERKL